jgi:hypothetical protein
MAADVCAKHVVCRVHGQFQLVLAEQHLKFGAVADLVAVVASAVVVNTA